MTLREKLIVAAVVTATLASFITGFALNNFAFIGFPIIIMLIGMAALGGVRN